MDLTDQFAIVTGSGRGIALVLAEHGADLVSADVQNHHAADVAATICDMGHRAISVDLDVTKSDSIERMTDKVINQFGKIDILVNNAGVFAASGFENRLLSNEDDWDATFEVNLKGMAMVTKAVTPHMKERHHGKIINISSVGGRQGDPINPAYMASKAGAINLTQSMALELAPYNINVNAICPGLVWTPMAELIEIQNSKVHKEMSGLPPKEIFDGFVSQMIPLNRDQSPEDIGRLTTFLASDYARNITGQSINVCGGARLN